MLMFVVITATIFLIIATTIAKLCVYLPLKGLFCWLVA